MLSLLAADSAGLLEYQGQGQAGVCAMVAIPAAHWVLQQQQPLHVLQAEA